MRQALFFIQAFMLVTLLGKGNVKFPLPPYIRFHVGYPYSLVMTTIMKGVRSVRTAGRCTYQPLCLPCHIFQPNSIRLFCALPTAPVTLIPSKHSRSNTVAQDKSSAVWGTVTMAMPQLIEWQIEGGDTEQKGQGLREFVAALSTASEGREAVLRLNLVVSL